MLDTLKERKLFDRLAIGLSGLCAIHCIATLFFLGALSSLGHLFASPLVHEVGLALAIVLATFAFYGGVKQHGALLPLIIGGCGLLFMTSALFVPHGMAEAVLTVIGVSLVALGHWLNHIARHSGCSARSMDDAGQKSCRL